MKTLLMIKPDMVEQRLHGEIIAFVLRNRFNINKLRVLAMDRDTAARFYEVHKERDFYPALMEYMTSGPVVAMEIEGEGVVERIRTFIGPTNPLDALPGTVRYMYGKSIQNNAVHASDSPESAKKELAIVFGHS
ncbi:MAG: nucleoside-diphosphate kinase [Candidatus Krumholzibacteriia bacterium]